MIGVVVVMVVVALIALSANSTDPNPKGTMALIFGVIVVFVVILFVLQRSDLERAAGGDAKAVQRAVAEGGGEIENPTTMEEQQLWAALAIKPIDNEAIKARGSIWDSSRRSQKLGWVVMALIFLTVPSIYLLESFVPLLIGGPLIAIAAIYGSIRALAPGEMDQSYEKVGLAMAPLGFEVTERPKINIEVREATTGRVGPKIHGALVLSGERHGRPVSVRIGSGEVSSRSEVIVRVATPEFKAESRDGKVRPGDDVPAPFAAALRDIPNSTRWKKMTVRVARRASSSLARAGSRPTGSATSGSPSAWPPRPSASSAAALNQLDRGVGLGGDPWIGQLDPGRQLDVQVV